MADLCDVGIYGLAVMGQNLALNFASRGVKIAVCNRSVEKTHQTVERAKAENVVNLVGCETPEEFLAKLRTPRKVIFMVKAGDAVDALIAQLEPMMEQGDLLVDGGNEHYENTERRAARLEGLCYRYMGMGVSGGEEGARHGPSLMPGGTRDGFAMLSEELMKITATSDSGPCVTYIGPGGSGHYVKMVHNGIEYGDMQLIAEAYSLLKTIGGLSNSELAEVFTAWNGTKELESFLIEITAQIFTKKDDLGTEKDLLDCIEDVAESKGTGKWTVVEAASMDVPCPTIKAAIDARNLSKQKSMRTAGSKIYPAPPPSKTEVFPSKEALVEMVKQALYCSKLCSYDQGFRLLAAKSDVKGWGLDFVEIARIWKAGCIIRAAFLDDIRSSFATKGTAPESLLFSDQFVPTVRSSLEGWRQVVSLAASAGVPVPAMSASLQYFGMVTADRLPLNLVQAQRDLFGAHTFRRTDREGSFHAQWQ